MNFLANILSHYNQLRKKFSMRSLNMGEVADLLMKDAKKKQRLE